MQGPIYIRAFDVETRGWSAVFKRLVFEPHRIQMVQQLSDFDQRRRLRFCTQLQDLMSSDDHFLVKARFGDEAPFRVSGAVNRLNVIIWGFEYPLVCVWHRCGSYNVNGFCAILITYLLHGAESFLSS